MPQRGTRKAMLAIVISILSGIFLPPLINVNRYRSNIASSISNAVGRPVTVGHVELRLLPQPGFDLRNVEVGDDPEINPEYLLHADEVTAYLRLSSLWRGRLEIARLNLTSPSLNLVRSPSGRWNLETLLSRTAQIPTAPTAQAHPETARRRFPYIEATAGRINFKFGLEKKAFTFTDADFALWLQSENNWQMRLDARPYRVDTHVTDVGTLEIEGSFQRNSMLRYTPVKLTATWRNGQLGQLTKLLTGSDRGWRGATTVTLRATGTPADLVLAADLRIDDFRRYDIFGGGTMRMLANCTGRYGVEEEKLADLHCQGPVGGGIVDVSGTVQRPSAPWFDITLTGKDVALSSVMGFVRHAKRDLPEDLNAEGTTEFSFAAHKAADPASKTLWSGEGTTSNLVLRSQALGPELTIGTLNYVIAAQAPDKPHHSMRGAIGDHALPPQQVAGFRLTVPTFPLALGATQSTQAQAVITEQGFNLSIAGDSDLARALQVARAFGIDTPRVAAKGDANLDLHLASHWTGFGAPELSGTIRLKNVQADVPGIIETVQINSAVASIDPKSLAIQNVVASFVKGPNLTGSVSIPRNCSTPSCAMTFVAHADEVSPERLNQLLNPKLRSRSWYNFFMPHPADQGDPLLSLAATGQFNIDRWKMANSVANHVNGNVTVANKRVVLANLHGDLLGGQHTGEWQADFSSTRPVFTGKGKFVHVNVAQFAETMHESWGTGLADLNYQVKISGSTPAELLARASGLGDFSVHDGLLRHVSLEGKSPLHINRLDGTVELREGNFVISEAKLQSGNTVYNLQGTATWKRELNLTLTDNQHVFALSGTLDRPEIKQAPATEAALHP